MLTRSPAPTQDFSVDGRTYRIRLLRSDPIDDAERTLVESFGSHYSFRDVRGEGLRVRSCGVFVDEAPLAYGAELDVVVDPPAGPGALLWVRVVHRVTASGMEGYIDSIGGVPPLDVGHLDRVERLADGAGVTPERLVARLFLVRDVGADVVTILGGVTYGWQVEEVGRGPAPGTPGGR